MLSMVGLHIFMFHQGERLLVLRYTKVRVCHYSIIAALVRDADREMAQVTAAMRDQVHNPSGHTHTLR